MTGVEWKVHHKDAKLKKFLLESSLLQTQSRKSILQQEVCRTKHVYSLYVFFLFKTMQILIVSKEEGRNFLLFWKIISLSVE